MKKLSLAIILMSLAVPHLLEAKEYVYSFTNNFTESASSVTQGDPELTQITLFFMKKAGGIVTLKVPNGQTKTITLDPAGIEKWFGGNAEHQLPHANAQWKIKCNGSFNCTITRIK